MRCKLALYCRPANTKIPLPTILRTQGILWSSMTSFIEMATDGVIVVVIPLKS